MTGVDANYDLWCDAATVDRDLGVTCWISHGPSSADPLFDPQPGDVLLVVDGEEAPLSARVVSREGDQVSLQVLLQESSGRRVTARSEL